MKLVLKIIILIKLMRLSTSMPRCSPLAMAVADCVGMCKSSEGCLLEIIRNRCMRSDVREEICNQDTSYVNHTVTVKEVLVQTTSITLTTSCLVVDTETVTEPQTTDIGSALTASSSVTSAAGSVKTTIDKCNSSVEVLAVFTGLLGLLLTAVITGWIGTCIMSKRRLAATKESNPKDNMNTSKNLSYGSSQCSTVAAQINYSSQGPAYEQIREGGETENDVINRNRPHPPTLPSTPHLIDQDYSTLDESGVEHYYHVLEPNIAGGLTMGGGPEIEAGDPQDYEIPTKMGN